MHIEPVVVFAIAVGLLANLVAVVVRRWLKTDSADKYQDFLFESLDPLTLPPRVLAYFDRFTPDIERLGFRHLGDYLLVRGTTTARSRFFISPDAQTIAGIDCWRWFFFRNNGTSFMSVFDDGTYHESAAMHPPADTLSRSTHLRLHYFPGSSLEDLYAHHQQAVRDHAASTASDVLEVFGDDFKKVVNYGHRLLHHALHAKGLVPEPPPLIPMTESTLTAAD